MEATRENIYKEMVFNSVLNALQPILEQQYQYARFSKYTPYNPNRKRYFNLHPKKYGRGHLRNTAIKKEEKFRHKNQSLYKKFSIIFDGNKTPYLDALQKGSKPHDIPNAFGYGIEFGVGGRFSGKFHPGSKKHKHFINKIYHGIYRDLKKIKNVYINVVDGTGEVKFQGFREKVKGR